MATSAQTSTLRKSTIALIPIIYYITHNVTNGIIKLLHYKRYNSSSNSSIVITITTAVILYRVS